MELNTDPVILKLMDSADIYICPACGKGLEDDECDAEILWRTGEIVESDDND